MPYEPAVSDGKLAVNILHFVRLLRAAGLPVGPGKVLLAVHAVQTVGITERQDFYWTLHAVLVMRRDQRELFDQAFHIFWRNPKLLERLHGLLLPSAPAEKSNEQRELSQRLADALGDASANSAVEKNAEQALDASLTFSNRELLAQKDFEKMSGAELVQAKLAIKQLRLGLETVATRRFRTDPNGSRIDIRASLRASLKTGAGMIPLLRKQRRQRCPPLVLLCDISGSMDRYSRMLLHFAHALSSDRERVYTFVFGTRLTNVTRQLRHKDVDIAIEDTAAAVQDWSGGTRIGHCLHDFNRFWSRRVLAQGAVVLLITDGLDRDAGAGLACEIERLHKSCRRLTWLNPLLRYDKFQPKALGMRALLPHVDELRAAHNISSLIELSAALSETRARRKKGVREWQKIMI